MESPFGGGGAGGGGEDTSALLQTYGDPNKKSGLWKHAALGVAGPLLAMLGSKLSGGGTSFGDGLASFGTGFAKTKTDQLLQQRDREHEQEKHFIRAAHEQFGKLKDLDPDIVAQFPDLQKYAQAYADKIADGKFTGKEAAELVKFSAAANFAQAQRAQETKNTKSTSATQHEAGRENIIGDLTMANRAQREGLSQGGDMSMGEPPWPGAGPEQDRAGAEELYGGALQSKYKRYPVDGVDLDASQMLRYKTGQQTQQNKQAGIEIARQRLNISREALGLSKDRFQNQKDHETDMLLENIANGVYSPMLGDVEGLSPEQIGAKAARIVEYLRSQRGAAGQSGLGMTPRPGAGGAPQGGGGFGANDICYGPNGTKIPCQ